MFKPLVLSIGLLSTLISLTAQAQTPLPVLKATPPPPINGQSDGLCFMQKGNVTIDLSHLCGVSQSKPTPATAAGAQPLPVPSAPPLSLPPAGVETPK